MPSERINKRLNRELRQIGEDSERILNRLYRLSQAAKGWSLLRISDEFAAIERAARRAKERTYDLYMWLGREEIKQQKKAGPPCAN